MGLAAKSNTIPNHDTGCRTTVVMNKATFQQAEARFVSKHNSELFRCPSPPFIVPLAAQTFAVSSERQRSNGRLEDIPLCYKRRRMILTDTER
ncbi:hypothetical protein TNCV_2686161 [Trichonephila clavipes]|nr:hypothetical protein TNCV_2686161 [Trichonephila clavipes]